MPTKTAKRAYDSSRRTRQAAETRDEVVRAGTVRFGETGWAGTTLADIADAAGVSVETIYKGFGSKKGLLREVMGAAVVGDSEPIPFAERPEFRALGEGSLDERIARAAELVTNIHERSAGVWQAIVEAAGADPEVAAWRVEMEQARRIDVGRSVTLVFGRAQDEELVTMIWVLYSPETYLKLINDAGFTREAYASFLVDATGRLAGVVPTGKSKRARA